ncbi:DUF3370 family protein [Streptomyces sp. VRA16 Mangrove soil]|uniref:DUF3370 family protein n=1 Tax=Streptomyces sp. VRA16 Mangrove soil TaxID=2817434 RepID=UPI001A9E7627|nr:DUF3370 family protein [Streptomyces sp. VRA16 Mangrove soil]MBO1332311.1 DUF3370 family protein [Streptomyces sp. VRA16 Mangrove soil]
MDRTTGVFGEDVWTAGEPTAPGPTVVRELLHPLPGAYAGPEIVVSNNPETVTGPGWLMQHARTTVTRGGTARALSGRFPLYLYHQNSTGQTAYLHILIANPGAERTRVSLRGTAWTNKDKPLIQDPAQRAGTGPCYATSEDWLTGNLRQWLPSTAVEPGALIEAARIPMTGSITDGLFEVTAASGVHTYTVVTLDGSTDSARRYALDDTATAPGNVISQTPTTYGRMSGVYAHSFWDAGRSRVDVPAAGHHLGLAVNVTGRQVPSLDQTAPATAALTDSSQRSWGNYGSWYDIGLRLRNTSCEPRTVRVTFGSNITAATDVPGDTWNGALGLTVDDGPEEIVTGYVRPTEPRDTLATLSVPPRGSRDVRLRFIVPGLISAGSQLLLESV